MLTIKDIKQAEKNGITETALRSRIYHGWSKEKALTSPMRKTLDKYYEIAEKNGISKQLVRTRIYQHGWPLEKAITRPKQKTKIYSEEHEKAVKNGLNITYQNFVNRIKKGWTIEEASTTPRGLTPENKDRVLEYRKYKNIALSNGISANTYSARIRSYGWDPERAATEPINEQYKEK
ncbi:hypothetical protein [Oceanobacillus sp. Castelsardo]|uniref:hypothetical protein n=1 Tax=Oceanobacillus sp. Castelsardo TaxID=1851204 RepID=UPI0008398CF8|nr:hypothetical protein [Oceanobacillus sp. Castelsardo]